MKFSADIYHIKLRNLIFILGVLLSQFGAKSLIAQKKAEKVKTVAQPEGFMQSSSDNTFLKTEVSGTRAFIPLSGEWEVQDENEVVSKVKIPSSYNKIGALVFHKNFSIDKTQLNKYSWRLVCGGIPYSSEITINGVIVGRHEGELGFTLSLRDIANLKEQNTIQIKVNNQIDYNTSPCRKIPLEPKTYGGITRDIALLGVPAVWVDEYRFNTYSLDSNNAKTKFRIKVNATNLKGLSFGSLIDTGGAKKITTDKAEFTAVLNLKKNIPNDTTLVKDTLKAEANFNLVTNHSANVDLDMTIVNPRTWSFENPNLYDATVKIFYKGSLVDERIFKFGISKLAISKNKIYLNEKPVVLKGVGYQMETKQTGQTIQNEVIAKDLRTIKQSGANLVRFIGGNPNEFVFGLCDELGLLALVDAQIGMPPASQFRNNTYVDRTLEVVSTTISKGMGYTSVLGFGLSAVIPPSEYAIKFAKKIKLLTNNTGKCLVLSPQNYDAKELLLLADILILPTFDIDVIDLSKKINEIKLEVKDKPILVSYGKICQLGNHNGYNDPLSIEAQAKYVSDAYNEITKQGLQGSIYWSFCDYSTDRPVLTANNKEQYILSVGLNDVAHNPRQSLNMLRSLLTESSPPTVLVGDFEEPSTIIFIVLGILCAVLSILMINMNSRFREDMMRAFLRPTNFFIDVRDQRIISTIQTISLSGVLAIILGVTMASVCYFYRTSENFDTLLSVFVKSDSLKEIINQVIWSPTYSIIFFTLFFILGVLLVTCFILLLAMALRKNVSFNDSFAISTWSALPALVLTPFIMFLYRLLSVSGISSVVVALLIVIGLWVLYRLYKGVATVYDMGAIKFFSISSLSVVLLVVIIYFSSSYFQSVISYIREGIGGLFL